MLLTFYLESGTIAESLLVNCRHADPIFDIVVLYLP